MKKLNTFLLLLITILLGVLTYKTFNLPVELLDTFFRPMGYHELTPRKEYQTKQAIIMLNHEGVDKFISFSVVLHFETEASIFGVDHFNLDYTAKTEALRVLSKIDYLELQTESGRQKFTNSLYLKLKNVDSFTKYKIFKISTSQLIFSE